MICAQQAVQDFGTAGPDLNVEVLFADHQNKPDIGRCHRARMVRSDGVDAVADVPTSSVALAVNTICREKNKVMLEFRRSNHRSDRRAMHPEHHPLDVRHLHARQIHRRRDGEERAEIPGFSSRPITCSASSCSVIPTVS